MLAHYHTLYSHLPLISFNPKQTGRFILCNKHWTSAPFQKEKKHIELSKSNCWSAATPWPLLFIRHLFSFSIVRWTHCCHIISLARQWTVEDEEEAEREKRRRDRGSSSTAETDSTISATPSSVAPGDETQRDPVLKDVAPIEEEVATDSSSQVFQLTSRWLTYASKFLKQKFKNCSRFHLLDPLFVVFLSVYPVISHPHCCPSSRFTYTFCPTGLCVTWVCFKPENVHLVQLKTATADCLDDTQASKKRRNSIYSRLGVWRRGLKPTTTRPLIPNGHVCATAFPLPFRSQRWATAGGLCGDAAGPQWEAAAEAHGGTVAAEAGGGGEWRGVARQGKKPGGERHRLQPVIWTTVSRCGGNQELRRNWHCTNSGEWDHLTSL